MKKKVIGIVVIIVLVVVFLGTSRLKIGNLLFWGGTYFDNPQEAFWDSYSPSSIENLSDEVITSLVDIDVVSIDDNNALYLALTDDGTVIISSMKSKNNRYTSSGDRCGFVDESLARCPFDYEERASYETIYNAYGLRSGEYTYALVKLDDNFSFDEDEYIIRKYEGIDNFPDFALVIEKEQA